MTTAPRAIAPRRANGGPVDGQWCSGKRQLPVGIGGCPLSAVAVDLAADSPGELVDGAGAGPLTATEAHAFRAGDGARFLLAAAGHHPAAVTARTRPERR